MTTATAIKTTFANGISPFKLLEPVPKLVSQPAKKMRDRELFVLQNVKRTPGTTAQHIAAKMGMGVKNTQLILRALACSGHVSRSTRTVMGGRQYIYTANDTQEAGQ